VTESMINLEGTPYRMKREKEAVYQHYTLSEAHIVVCVCK